MAMWSGDGCCVESKDLKTRMDFMQQKDDGKQGICKIRITKLRSCWFLRQGDRTMFRLIKEEREREKEK